ncbi:CBS domain-containing protein [Aliikangiella sp. IMCC44359]|uniref:CBS domain-containing protein n=1 Tax=Aliikangiella sp. IMCC44359 TaxID=3459125 RepID=UPI00403B2CBD
MTLKVSNFMTNKVHTAHSEDGIRETFFRMRELTVRHLPVVDDNNQLVGIISDRDLRRPNWVDEAPDLSHIYRLDDDIQVGDLMSKNVVVAHTYESISKVAKVLLEHRYGALPVLNKAEELVGILSAFDLLKALDSILNEQKSRRKVAVKA